MNIFKKKESLPIKGFDEVDKSNLLPHEILKELMKRGMTTAASGIGNEMIPIYDFQIGSAYMQFSTLVGILNNPENSRYKNENGNIVYLKRLATSKKEITITKYSYEDISAALEILKFNEDVSLLTDNTDGLLGKTITLLKKGFISYHSNYYLKQFRKESNEISLHESIINTNYWTKRYTRILAKAAIGAFIIAFLSLLLSYMSYRETQRLTPPTTQDIQNIQSTLQLIQKNQTYMNSTLKELGDSLSMLLHHLKK